MAVALLPMDQPNSPSTEERLGKLEQAVADIERRLQALTEALANRFAPDARRQHEAPSGPLPQHPGTADPMLAQRRTVPHAGKSQWRLLVARGPQFWISRLGIGLVLLAVVFLFDYAIDQGWLTPPIRVGIGITLGVALAAIGVTVRRRRKERWFSQLMLGGASAAWYVTGFASFQLLHVFSYPVAFAFMVLVTGFTFWAGIHEDGAALGVLGAIGGLGTPVFLYTGEGSVPALVGYTCLVLLGTSGIYLVKGWRSLLWTSVVGGWTIFLIAFANSTPSDRWALQAGIGVAWLMWWLVPVGRAWLASENPAEWPTPKSWLADQLSRSGGPAHRHGDVAVLTAALPVGVLFLSRATWEVGDAIWGAVAVAAAILYAVGARVFRPKTDLRLLSSAHMVGVAILTVIAAALFFGEHLQILSWATLAVGFLYAGQRLDETALAACGHILSLIVGLWLFQRMTGEGGAETAVFTARGLSDAGVVLGFLAASLWSGSNATKWYLLAAHVGFLGWLWRELAALPSGQAIVTACFGVYGLLLLSASVKTRKAGLATLLVAVAKLFLVDLDRVDPFLRILLFLGFGALFLTISYYYRDRIVNADDTVQSVSKE
ncbi:MAG: DUF2339 domain-containing protein [Gemmatimonadales bacterium]